MPYMERADSECLAAVSRSDAMLVPFVLMASYAAHCSGEPIISTCLFEELTRRLDHHWDRVEHPQKHAIPRDQLRDRAHFVLPDAEYPSFTAGAVEHFRIEALLTAAPSVPGPMNDADDIQLCLV